MMENKNQPAFPDTRRAAHLSSSNLNPEDWPTGLTKREYFAVMAMQGLLAGQPNIDDMMVAVPYDAVRLADALLIELSTPQP